MGKPKVTVTMAQPHDLLKADTPSVYESEEYQIGLMCLYNGTSVVDLDRSELICLVGAMHMEICDLEARLESL